MSEDLRRVKYRKLRPLLPKITPNPLKTAEDNEFLEYFDTLEADIEAIKNSVGVVGTASPSVKGILYLQNNLSSPRSDAALNTVSLKSIFDGISSQILSLQSQIDGLQTQINNINSSGVASFNGRTGEVSLLASDVSNALGYTPISQSFSGNLTGNVNFTQTPTVSGNNILHLGIFNPSTGNVYSASRLQNARAISISGAVDGYAYFDGTENINIETVIGSVTSTAIANAINTHTSASNPHPQYLLTTENAATASKLLTARTITIAGAVSGSADFDGSQNITINVIGGGGGGGGGGSITLTEVNVPISTTQLNVSLPSPYTVSNIVLVYVNGLLQNFWQTVNSTSITFNENLVNGDVVSFLMRS